MKILSLGLALLMLASPAFAATPATPAGSQVGAQVGQPAPDFKGLDSKGQTQTLSQYKGKIVVLEWSNPFCPYVGKHYDSRNMQNLQKEALAEDVIWLTVVSSAEGKEGYMSAADAEKYMAAKGSAPTARILDASGEIGRAYGAKTTPHMFVVDPSGTLVYAGAIDDNDSFKPETVATAKNYVREAIASIKSGKPLEISSTKSYGCSVKYVY